MSYYLSLSHLNPCSAQELSCTLVILWLLDVLYNSSNWKEFWKWFIRYLSSKIAQKTQLHIHLWIKVEWDYAAAVVIIWLLWEEGKGLEMFQLFWSFPLPISGARVVTSTGNTRNQRCIGDTITGSPERVDHTEQRPNPTHITLINLGSTLLLERVTRFRFKCIKTRSHQGIISFWTIHSL